MIASFTIAVAWQPEPVLVFKLGLGIVFFFLGLLMTLLLAAAMLGRWRQTHQAKQMVEMAQRAQDAAHRRFIRNLDHEIKNPLTVLQAALVNLREARGQTERQPAEANAYVAVDQLRRLLDDLRKLSDLDDRPLERFPVEVPELLEEMVAAARSLPIYAQRSVNLLISKVPWPLPSVTGDRDLLGLAFYNLIENSLKFSTESDTVEVRAHEDSRLLVVEVANSDPGIPPEDQPQVFEELYRGSNARGVGGSGLGLALVRRIVQLHGGQVSLRSRQEGVGGTIFTIRLPVTKL
jgi:two-component system OmpR family sensor kinase